VTLLALPHFFFWGKYTVVLVLLWGFCLSGVRACWVRKSVRVYAYMEWFVGLDGLG